MNPLPSSVESDDDDMRSMLSALMDGQADPAAVQRSCAHWREDPAVPSTWHAYHLIGDVLRSDDLAGTPVRDAAFLASLRERLRDEPALLAPAPLAPATSAQQTPRRSAWLVPTAVAAGFVAVAGVLVVTRLSAPEPTSAQVLAGGNVSQADGMQRVGTAPAASQPVAMDGQLVRDARLDAYLRAHRGMRDGSAAALPGGAMRSAETLAPQR